MSSLYRSRLRWGDAVLFVLVAANVVWVGANVGALVNRLYLNADIASAPVIGSLVASAPAGRTVTLGNYPWIEPFWFMEATRWLPSYQQVWEAAPFLVFLADLTLLVVAARLAVGRRAALFTGLLFCCTTTATRFVLFTPNAHGAALFHGLLLGAALVVAVRYSTQITTPALLGGALVLAVITGLGVTDLLLVVAGLVPFVVAAWFGWWRTRALRERRLALVAINVAMLSLLVSGLTRLLMAHVGVVSVGSAGLIDSFGQFAANVSTFVHAFSYLGGGDVLISPVRAASFPALAAGMLTLAGAVLVAYWCLLETRRGGGRTEVGWTADLTRETYVVFWAATFACSTIAFVFSSAPQDTGASRYLMAAFVAVLALLPAVVPRSATRTQFALVVGACAFALLSLHAAIGEDRYAYGSALAPTDVQGVVRYASQHGLRYGYADYSTAPALTWATGVRVQVFPVQPCRAGLCPFYLHTISSWYTPRFGVRTFFIVNRATQGSYKSVAGTIRALGQPVEKAQIGNLTIYVYDHDLAADLGYR